MNRMHVLTQVYVTIRMDDAFTLNCRPTVPVGCEEQVVDAKRTRPFLPLVKGLAPRLLTTRQLSLLLCRFISAIVA